MNMDQDPNALACIQAQKVVRMRTVTRTEAAEEMSLCVRQVTECTLAPSNFPRFHRLAEQIRSPGWLQRHPMAIISECCGGGGRDQLSAWLDYTVPGISAPSPAPVRGQLQITMFDVAIPEIARRWCTQARKTPIVIEEE
jgi:hypothetical protein